MRRVDEGGFGLLLFEGLEARGLRCAHSTAPLDVRREDERRRFVAAAGLSPDRVASPVQVHGADVVRVDAPTAGTVEADGLVTDVPGLALLVKAADCSLIVVADPVRRAVGVAHAGWRGAAAGIARNLVAALGREYGSAPGDLVAGVGPTIGVNRYAVGAEVLGAFRELAPWADEYARIVEGRLHYDVAGANGRVLEACGVRRVEIAGICTHESEGVLFSYRRQGPGAGHHGLVTGWE